MNEHWRACRESFLRQIFDRSGSLESLRTYSRTLDKFLSDGRQPDSYLRSDVEAFCHAPCTALQCEPGQLPSPATQNQRLTVIRSFYQFAATWTIAGEDGWPVPLMSRVNPASGIRRAGSTRSYKAMPLADLQALFSVIPLDSVAGLRDYSLLVCLFLTCRRRSEILRLTWQDLQRVTITDSQGTREIVTFRFFGKGHSRVEDHQELSPVAWAAVERYLKMAGRRASIKPEDPLFTAIKRGNQRLPGEQPLSCVSIFKLFAKYLDKAGLSGKGYSIHSLRHSSAQQRAQAGESILSIQHTLRHASLATTSGYLAQLTTPADDGARLLAERMPFLV